MQPLAVIVRRLRLDRRLSQQALARKVGVSSPRISEIERGLSNPTLSTLEALADALGVPLVDLFPSATKVTRHARS